jgi:hypothetical protein
LKKQVLEISCDVCGRDLDDSSVSSERAFTIDGVPYQIDLCSDHAAEFSSAIAPFVANGRRISRPRQAKATGSRSPRQAGDLKSVRTWAAANGFEVSERGRLPGQVIAAYNSANGTDEAADTPGGRSTRGGGRGDRPANGRGRDARQVATN